MMITNDNLREHVTRTGFDLSLGKTHIMALVWLDLYLAEDEQDWRKMSREFHPRPQPRVMAHSITGMRGLYERGLARNLLFDGELTEDGLPTATPRQKFAITDAGHLVIGLLREAGIYDEFAALIPLRTREIGPNVAAG